MSIDYLDKYLNEEGFEFSKLINDDFFQPVRILFKEKHYVSATKLLMVAIDTMAFIEFGDVQDNVFIKWLDTYGAVESMGITSEELWEQRNSLLHMSNLDSRKVLAGKTRRLFTYVGRDNKDIVQSDSKTGYYSLTSLIKVVATASVMWCDTYDKNREKIDSFIERYDLITSDARMLHIKLS